MNNNQIVSHMKNTILFFFLIFSSFTYSQNVNEKIKSLENNLNAWDKTKTKKTTLKERMDFYEVNALRPTVLLMSLRKDQRLQKRCFKQHRLANRLTV